MKSIILSLLRKCSALRAAFAGCELGQGVILNGIPYIRRKGKPFNTATDQGTPRPA